MANYQDKNGHSEAALLPQSMPDFIKNKKSLHCFQTLAELSPENILEFEFNEHERTWVHVYYIFFKLVFLQCLFIAPTAHNYKTTLHQIHWHQQLSINLW